MCKLGFNSGFQTRVWNPRPRDIILGEDGDWVNSRILERNPRACYPLGVKRFAINGNNTYNMDPRAQVALRTL